MGKEGGVNKIGIKEGRGRCTDIYKVDHQRAVSTCPATRDVFITHRASFLKKAGASLGGRNIIKGN